MVGEAFVGFMETNEFYLMVSTFVLVGIFLLILAIYLIRNYFYHHHKNKLGKTLKAKGFAPAQKHGKKKNILKVFSWGKDDNDVTEVSSELSEIIKSEKELKERERLLTKKIEELYLKTRPLVEDSPEFVLTKPKKKKVIKKEESEKEESSETESNNKKITALDEETKKVLKITDNLLEKLPDEVIEEFVNSEDFKTYKKVVSKVKENE